jgi:hypothetical protein
MPLFENIKVGDKITVRYYQHITVRTVTSVTKTGFTDSSDQKWTTRGREWGNQEHGAWCDPWKPEDDKAAQELQVELKKKRRRNMVLQYNYALGGEAFINEVAAAIRKEEERKTNARSTPA